MQTIRSLIDDTTKLRQLSAGGPGSGRHTEGGDQKDSGKKQSQYEKMMNEPPPLRVRLPEGGVTYKFPKKKELDAGKSCNCGTCKACMKAKKMKANKVSRQDVAEENLQARK